MTVKELETMTSEELETKMHAEFAVMRDMVDGVVEQLNSLYRAIEEDDPKRELLIRVEDILKVL
jgi:hypothetical protein